jgi:hypothetical protein
MYVLLLKALVHYRKNIYVGKKELWLFLNGEKISHEWSSTFGCNKVQAE